MDYLKLNKEGWDKRTHVHVQSKFYDVDGFLSGKTSLKEIELSELKDVEGKKLLHLQCHFGLDTLSWARKGAIVTGVDLSPAAIRKANELKKQVNLNARFICSDIYEFGKTVTEEYDIVFTSYGVLTWLPDLTKWAEIVARSLKPGGQFYIAEFHPVHDLVRGYNYFYQSEPDVEEEGTYTENDAGESSTMVTWGHHLGKVINSLIKAGIQIQQFNEYPYSPYDCFEDLEEREEGRYYFKKMQYDVPLVYSILGKKAIS